MDSKNDGTSAAANSLLVTAVGPCVGAGEGMLEINSSTSLSVLFQSLEFSASEVDRQKQKRAVMEAARKPPPLVDRSFASATHPHLTHWASAKANSQFLLQHNYDCLLKDGLGDDSTYWVWDKRPVSDKPEGRRVVQVTLNSMQCSCNFPLTHLLPCRHVIVVNLFLYKVPFIPKQVGQRWLKWYKPAPAYQSVEPSPPLQVAIPSFIPSLVQAGTLPAKNARYGQMMGYCMTICQRAVDYNDLFHSTLQKIEAVCSWIEAESSTPSQRRHSAAPSSSASSASSPSSSSGERLHQSLEISQVTFAEHRRKVSGRLGQKRQKGTAERQGEKKSRVSASQV
jgi:hypothetical protein